ncbi:unnamed protein product [Adineta ricciae]|uniref:GATOR2 complex protein WDR24 n=1 Tax=Adineta ricciae TaxID=249248 RepID=A0A815BN68_ADIRI|nr:unnamed protein product [Adineta ricciae]
MNSAALYDFLSGIAGATASVYVGQPLDTIKTKLQTFPNRYKNFVDCAQKIFYKDGLHGLYAGTVPSLLANAAENGVLFMAYGQCQNLICSLNHKANSEELNSLENMAAGSLAAAFASLALCPTELVKCRIQTINEMTTNKDIQKRKTISPMTITRNIIRTEGARGLYRGLTATLLRECPGYGCFFGGYELTRTLLTKENEAKKDIGFVKTWLSGGMAGICFWIFMFPIDAIKSRVQVFQPNMSVIKYTLHIIRNEDSTNLTPFSYKIRTDTNTVVCLNHNGNRVLVAGQLNFQLLTIDQVDDTEQFNELHDFRNASKQARTVLQPTDIGWNPNDEHFFASGSTTGLLNIWDVSQLAMISQIKIHNSRINRLQFHPTNPKLLLTASQDGYAKLIDFRTYNTNKVVASFRHVSEDGFRDIHINTANPNLFAAALNDQCIVPLWDIRRIESPAIVLTAADRTLCLAWNVNEPYWLATGGRDRTIRVWNAQDSNTRQEPLFKVQSFGTVAKLSWRPACRYHIACSTLSADPRVHVWDVRRAYLPYASFCHHQNRICDFSWRSNSDNLVSVGRDERLIHAHISTAIKTDQFVSLFSLNVSSKGHVYSAMPNIDNEYVRALYAEHHIPTTFTSLKKYYSQEIMSTFVKWNEQISAKSIIGIYKNSLADNSVEAFHQFARRWSFGTGDKSPEVLGQICDINGSVAEQLKRPDLKATWQVVKMIYADYDGLQCYRVRSSRNTPSATKTRHISDSLSGHRHHHHHHHHHYHHHFQQQTSGKLNGGDVAQQDVDFNEELNGRNRIKSQDQIMPSNSQIEIIDDTDTYIVRDVLTDDIIFITPEDALNSSNGYDMLYENEIDIETMHDGMPVMSNETPSMINGESDMNGFTFNRLSRQYVDVMMYENEFGPTNDFDGHDSVMQESMPVMLPDGSDNFFTIDESYCPTMQNHPLVFDDIIRETIWYYVENNELQVAVHLLLVLYPKLGEHKAMELFNGDHFRWIGMYIELLQKLRLFVKAKQVTKHCLEKEKIPLIYESADFDGSLILCAQSPALRRLHSSSHSSTISNSSKTSLPTPKDFMCSICRIPCRGVFSFCGVCFHGGHNDHIRTWFNTRDECPHGCGHRCKDRDTQSRRSRGIPQRFTSKSSFVFQQ